MGIASLEARIEADPLQHVADERAELGARDETVHQRNLMHDPRVALHLSDTIAAVIVEGTARWRQPSDEEAGRIAETTRVKYAKYGYPANAEDYAAGVWGLSPAVVLAWERLDVDATRFVFRPSSTSPAAGGSRVRPTPRR